MGVGAVYHPGEVGRGIQGPQRGQHRQTIQDVAERAWFDEHDAARLQVEQIGSGHEANPFAGNDPVYCLSFGKKGNIIKSNTAPNTKGNKCEGCSVYKVKPIKGPK